jgi:hypothetical protein
MYHYGNKELYNIIEESNQIDYEMLESIKQELIEEGFAADQIEKAIKNIGKGVTNAVTAPAKLAGKAIGGAAGFIGKEIADEYIDSAKRKLKKTGHKLVSKVGGMKKTKAAKFFIKNLEIALKKNKKTFFYSTNGLGLIQIMGSDPKTKSLFLELAKDYRMPVGEIVAEMFKVLFSKDIIDYAQLGRETGKVLAKKKNRNINTKNIEWDEKDINEHTDAEID